MKDEDNGDDAAAPLIPSFIPTIVGEREKRKFCLPTHSDERRNENQE